MKLLLISNSTNAGEEYLKYPINQINNFLGDLKSEVMFLPYAAVTFTYDDYEKMVQQRFQEIGIEIKSIHHYKNPQIAIENAKAIIIGGGNTFKLLKIIQENNLIEVISNKVINENMPYIGWSAGTNMACPTIRTTNDMPVVEPKDMNGLNLIPFQINPHYQDANPDGFSGETREQRLLEFIEMNKEVYIAGLREGTMFEIIEKSINLIGNKPVRIFKYGIPAKEFGSMDNLDFLLN